jgi:hypothetical protein
MQKGRSHETDGLWPRDDYQKSKTMRLEILAWLVSQVKKKRLLSFGLLNGRDPPGQMQERPQTSRIK